MRITYRPDPQPPAPVTSIVELSETDRTLLVDELQRMNGWTASKQPVLHTLWSALKHKEIL